MLVNLRQIYRMGIAWFTLMLVKCVATESARRIATMNSTLRTVAVTSSMALGLIEMAACCVIECCSVFAGIEAPALLAQLGPETNRVNQVVVDGLLRTSDPAIYAFGDCAQAPWDAQGKKFLPARAQVAHQQASFLVPTLAERIRGKPVKPRHFVFHDRGSLVSIGTSQGVGSLMGVLSGKRLFVQGAIGRLMYMSLHLLHHQAFLGTARTILLPFARLLMRRGEPRVKLH